MPLNYNILITFLVLYSALASSNKNSQLPLLSNSDSLYWETVTAALKKIWFRSAG